MRFDLKLAFNAFPGNVKLDSGQRARDRCGVVGGRRGGGVVVGVAPDSMREIRC